MRSVATCISTAGLVFGLLTAMPAFAADQELVTKLAPEIAKYCRPSSAIAYVTSNGRSGVMSASDLGRAIYASKVAPLTAEYDWNRKGGREIARMAFADDQGINATPLNLLQRLVQTWVGPMDASAGDYLPLAAGGVTVEDVDGVPAELGQAQAVLAAILDGADDAFRFRCALSAEQSIPGGEPETAKETHRPALLISKAPDDLSKVKLTDRPFAEIAYLDDRDAHKDSLSIYGTVGLVWPDIVYRSAAIRAQQGGSIVRFAPMVFAQIEREGTGATDPNDVNNLNFGLQLGGFLQTRTPPGRPSRTLTHYFDLNARYLTDTHFASSGWSIAAQFTPGIPLIGNNVPYVLPGNRIQLRWRFTGVADHISIDDPGKKTKLVGAPQFSRLGFDVTGTAKYFFDEDHEQAITLGFDYSLRENLGAGPGDAQLFSGKFLIEPTPNFSFGIVYDRGENLDTFEHNETVKLTFGVRR